MVQLEGQTGLFKKAQLIGALWIIDGLTPYKVADNVSWDDFLLGYSIENVSPQHASVLDSELRIHEVYKQ